MTETATMSTKPTQTPSAYHLSVDVLALHDLWRARDPLLMPICLTTMLLRLDGDGDLRQQEGGAG